MRDLIDRQAAIDAVEFGIIYAKAINKSTGEVKELFKEGNDALKEAVERLKELPSAQPEIIRCKDCKYCDKGIDEDGNPFLKCLGWVYGGTQKEDFCSHAERRAG